MLSRDELAKEIYLADNWKQPREEAEEDWGVLMSNGRENYAIRIANALMPLIRGDMAEAWGVGWDCALNSFAGAGARLHEAIANALTPIFELFTRKDKK